MCRVRSPSPSARPRGEVIGPNVRVWCAALGVSPSPRWSSLPSVAPVRGGGDRKKMTSTPALLGTSRIFAVPPPRAPSPGRDMVGVYASATQLSACLRFLVPIVWCSPIPLSLQEPAGSQPDLVDTRGGSDRRFKGAFGLAVKGTAGGQAISGSIRSAPCRRSGSQSHTPAPSSSFPPTIGSKYTRPWPPSFPSGIYTGSPQQRVPSGPSRSSM